ncbi:hypothetical protein CONLIGDRAFT_682507 [Coniochaeta ligniaria NRRL 30616]|uniref:Uncharacterized protein n=1 Tax=Coniochaeta ligniaria NRRL 30616 TaxID=1408157 RepID=A0A1J7JCK0_9PEZI|nr:hypothetical protein CONLIGDRAFT_682507 [Coniochaeta ligniaria NRRL 30616]
MAVITGLLAALDTLGKKESEFKNHILEALNATDHPGDPYTWEGARRAKNSLKAGGRDKWGPEGHLGLLMGLIAILDKEKIKASTHKDVVLEAFKAQGLEDYTWEGIR